jgi:hypothetical protein
MTILSLKGRTITKTSLKLLQVLKAMTPTGVRKMKEALRTEQAHQGTRHMISRKINGVRFSRGIKYFPANHTFTLNSIGI